MLPYEIFAPMRRASRRALHVSELSDEAKKALAGFAEQGLRPTLVDLYSLPFDEEAVVKLVRQNGAMVLSVEDNYGAGIGAAVATALTHRGVPCRVRQMHVRRPPKSGRTPDDILSYLNLAASDIVREGTALVKEIQR